MGTDRRQFQELAEQRLHDAQVLFGAQRWAGAYYLLGYCVECALKSCITRQLREHEMPDKELVDNFYIHNLEKLLNKSGIREQFDSKCKANAAFQKYWDTVRNWNEQVRYVSIIPEIAARELHEAITNEKSGILPWLKTLW